MKKFYYILLLLLTLLMINKTDVSAYGFGFKKNYEHRQPEIGRYNEEIAGTNSYYVGEKNLKNIYLTFDVGYDNGTLSKILDVLKEKEVKATFFVTGDFLEREEELVLRIVNEGHIVGNHTYDHKNITKLSQEALETQIKKIESKYKDITGKEMEHYFRPPEGEFNKESLMKVSELGYKTFFWSIAYVDWNVNNQKGENYCYENIMNHLHNGAIILMHTVSSDNASALSRIIDDSRSKGYTFKNLNEFS